MIGRDGANRLAVVALMAGVVGWLWPIGFGGMMPVGGDVTQFSVGPMAVFARAVQSGRLPLWNDLWGYGFPGVGESQMGVFYPPHWLLYGLLPLEIAYTASLVLHTLWGALGSFHAARRFGASAAGAALGGFAWATCGFFVIHLPHQWGYTTGCWMPWAWGLAWSVARGEGRPRDPFLLALVLAVQLLPGHFQLAFETQVGVVVLTGLALMDGVLRRNGASRRGMVVLMALVGAFLLSAAQVWPTLRLARLASSRRDFEYLSGFAASPVHLVSFFAPGLFGRSPLWRPLVWEPFHTAPEEYLGFVGIVPLFLAFGAIGGSWRQLPAVRALAVVGGITLMLSLGPYLPGYRTWSMLPGCSFFRAPARWILATSLALSLLAAIGFDLALFWKRPSKAVFRFVALGIGVSAAVVVLIELALVGGAVNGAFSKAMAALPWRESLVFDRAVAAARRPNLDFRVQESWARQGVRLAIAPRGVFVEERFAVYRDELTATGFVYLGLLLLALLAGRRSFRAALIVLAVVDLGIVGRQRRLDLGPVESLVKQSPILAGLAKGPYGLRSVDTLGNLPMVAAAAPVSAYRTLDLPALDTLTLLAGRLPARAEEVPIVVAAARATGAGVRVLDPFQRREWLARGLTWPGTWTDVRDPALAGWKFGTDWTAQQAPWASTFRVVSPDAPAPRAYLVPLTGGSADAILETWTGNPVDVLNALASARILDVRRESPERLEIVVPADAPALVVISALADPEWRAEWLGSGSEVHIERAFGRPNQGAWQAVHVPGGGARTLRLVYRGRDVSQGMTVSVGGFLLFAGLSLRYGRNRKREEGKTS